MCIAAVATAVFGYPPTRAYGANGARDFVRSRSSRVCMPRDAATAEFYRTNNPLSWRQCACLHFPPRWPVALDRNLEPNPSSDIPRRFGDIRYCRTSLWSFCLVYNPPASNGNNRVVFTLATALHSMFSIGETGHLFVLRFMKIP